MLPPQQLRQPGFTHRLGPGLGHFALAACQIFEHTEDLMSLLSSVLVLPRSLYLTSWPLSKNSQAIPSAYILTYLQRVSIHLWLWPMAQDFQTIPYFSDTRCVHTWLSHKHSDFNSTPKHINGALIYWMSTGTTSQYSQAPPRASQSSVS